MTTRHVWAYGVGHVNNDLCASMWFIYLSYYLIEVVGLTSQVAGYAILSG
jgi:Na+/melibiose symporter-like transporter